MLNTRFDQREAPSVAHFSQYEQFATDSSWTTGEAQQNNIESWRSPKPPKLVPVDISPEVRTRGLDSLAQKHNAVLGTRNDPLARSNIDAEQELYSKTLTNRSIVVNGVWALVIVGIAAFLLFWTFDGRKVQEDAASGDDTLKQSRMDMDNLDQSRLDEQDSSTQKEETYSSEDFLNALMFTFSLGLLICCCSCAHSIVNSCFGKYGYALVTFAVITICSLLEWHVLTCCLDQETVGTITVVSVIGIAILIQIIVLLQSPKPKFQWPVSPLEKEKTLKRGVFAEQLKYDKNNLELYTDDSVWVPKKNAVLPAVSPLDPSILRAQSSVIEQ